MRAALYALPEYFASDLEISNVRATDLFAFNSALGATVEEQVVLGLNRLRHIWDADKQFAEYRFVRQPQTFPDVVLKASEPDADPQMHLGIELKGWYALAKEREPSFRYQVSPNVCADEDMLVVFPWALDRVISGTPKLFAPFIVNARHAAEMKNWYWQHVTRAGTPEGAIQFSQVTGRYPVKTEQISDHALHDSGKNFGRLARTNVMDAYREALFGEELSGIPLDAWQRFLKLFGKDTPAEEVRRELDRMAARLVSGPPAPSGHSDEVKQLLRAVAELLADLV